MLLRRIFKTRLQVVIATLAVFYLLNVSLQSIFFGADKEIIYDYTTDVFLCLKNSTTCVYSGELKLGNTGEKTVKDITVNFSDIPKELSVSLNIRDLNAAHQRDKDPEVNNFNLKDGNDIKISDFSPGALIIVKFSGNIPAAKKRQLIDLGINVESGATVINADPQGTEFGRIWTSFL